MRRVSAGIGYMALAAFSFSVMSLFVRLVGARLPSQEIVLVRSAVTLAYSYALVRWAGIPLWGQDRLWLVLRGVAGFAALSCFYYALTRLPLADATVIQYTNPAFTALLAAIFLNESMGWTEVGGTLLSLAGVALIARPAFLFGAGTLTYGLADVGVALAGALLSAVAYVIVRKLRRTEHHLVIVFYFPLVSVLGSLPGALPSAVWPTWTEWLMLVAGVGLAAQFGQIFLTKGLYRERAGTATAVSYLQVVFAAVWGMLFLGEYPDRFTVAGALLIVAGTLLATRRRAPPREQEEPAS